MLSSHLALPRQGHLDQVIHMLLYLKKYHNSCLIFDSTEPDIDMSEFERKDWTSSEFGLIDGVEEFPSNALKPRGIGVTTWARADADHADDTTTRRSRTGFLVYINSAPVY